MSFYTHTGTALNFFDPLGLDSGFPDRQVPQFQKRLYGPVPEGLYRINLGLDSVVATTAVLISTPKQPGANRMRCTLLIAIFCVLVSRA
jgi:hypothetical protein